MLTVIVDYDSGNLHSAAKAFQRMAREASAGEVRVSARPEDVARADRVVLPGVGAFADCRAGLATRSGLEEAVIAAATTRARPFLGICVGMQLMAARGLEHGDTAGFGWIAGEVVPIEASDPAIKVPHMGWNDLVLDAPHPLWKGIHTGDHAYFVHSYHFRTEDSSARMAHVKHGGPITAAVARGNIFGTQFHPEKSQAVGLRLIGNFLNWRP